MFFHCPKCKHQPLPVDQSLPAECPSCGVILAKVALLQARTEQRGMPAWHTDHPADDLQLDNETDWRALLFHVPERIDNTQFWGRAVLLAVFAVWGLWLMTRSVPEGEMMQSFIHLPLLVFHEAGHVLFMPLGQWLCIAGGTLMQWLMPMVLGIALLRQNRDPFGAAFALWLLGVSVMDTAPYMYDALHPKLPLLGGGTGEDGGHDFIFLLDSVGLLHRAQGLGMGLHKLGAALMLLALGWAGWLLRLQHHQRADVMSN